MRAPPDDPSGDLRPALDCIQEIVAANWDPTERYLVIEVLAGRSLETARTERLVLAGAAALQLLIDLGARVAEEPTAPTRQ